MIDKIFDSLSTAIVCLDEELKCLLLNPAAESLLDTSRARSQGAKISQLLLDHDDLESVLEESLKTEQPYTRRQSELVLLSGQVMTVDYTVSIANNDGQKMLLLEMFPISRYLRIDKDELLRDHHDAHRRMIRGMAHEIKNPLGGIKGSAQLLERELVDQRFWEYTSIIVDEADRLTRLVDRMLGPNTLPKPKTNNIHEILEKISTLLQTESGGAVRIVRDYDPSIPEFIFDHELVMQALLNIARNALQALDKTHDPCITLATRVERQFTIGKIKHRLAVKVDILDNGPGIPNEIREKLFYPMISGRAQGSGLGLSLAQSIIHQHEGTVEFKSKPGETTFTLFFPLNSQSQLDGTTNSPMEDK